MSLLKIEIYKINNKYIQMFHYMGIHMSANSCATYMTATVVRYINCYFFGNVEELRKEFLVACLPGPRGLPHAHLHIVSSASQVNRGVVLFFFWWVRRGAEVE